MVLRLRTHTPLSPLSATLLALLAIMLLAACNRPSKPVARVGDTWVGQERWVEFLKEAKMDPKLPKPQKEKALHALVRRAVASEVALKKGLDKQVLSKERKDLILEQTVVYQLLQDRIEKQPPFTDQQVKEYYDARTAQRRIKHVPCTTEAEAKACLADLKSGKPFKEALAKYCMDKGTLQAEGDLGFRSRSEVPAKFADAIFEAADGAVLGPFQAQNGWEVVVVVERRAPADSTFTLQKDKVVGQMNRERADRLRRELIQEAQKKYSIKIRQDALPAVLDPKVLPADEKTVVAELGTTTITLAELKRFTVAIAKRSNSTPSLLKADLGKYLTMMSSEKAVLALARQQGLDRRKDILAKVWNAEQDHLSGAFSEVFLRDLAVSQETLKTFFDANKESFRAPNEAMVRYYQAEKEDVLRQAVEEIRRKTPLAQVQKKYAVEVLQGGKATPFDYAKPPVPIPQQTMRAIGTAPAGAWLGVFPSGAGFMAIELVSTKAGKEMTFEEAGDRVRNGYINKNGMQLMEAYLDGEGRKGLKVETFEKNL
jgi:hypothetical protein